MSLSLRELKWGIRWSCCFKKNYSNHSVCHIIIVAGCDCDAEDIKNITVSHEPVCVMPYFICPEKRMKDSFMFYFALDTLTIAIKITLTELKNKNRI